MEDSEEFCGCEISEVKRIQYSHGVLIATCTCTEKQVERLCGLERM